MKSNIIRSVLIFLFALMITAGLLVPQPADCSECRIIRIFGEGSQSGKLHVEPQILTISKGTCVIWVNWSKEQEVSVKFEETMKCHDVTDSPMMFSLDSAQCYVTSWIPLGGTSSLRFNDPGELEYIVTNRDGSMTKGRIFVEQ